MSDNFGVNVKDQPEKQPSPKEEPGYSFPSVSLGKRRDTPPPAPKKSYGA
jgi:hypothetical protein